MAARQQLEILLEGVDEWNLWRTENPELRINLIGADLSDTNLVGANLTEADLTEARLIRAHLGRATLNGAILTRANLNEAILTEAKLIGSHLSGASLNRVYLAGADLTRADLTEANFSRADLIGVNLHMAILWDTVLGDTNLVGAVGLETCRHQGPSILDHRTIMRSRHLPLSFLRGCGLPDAFIDYLPSLLNQAIAFYSCFISYSHEDKAFARRLHDTLQGHGIRCWLDEKQLRGGDDILDHVDRGIRLWDKVLLCCSKNSLTSRWVEAEIDKALEKEQMLWKQRQEKVLALIPLDLDGYLFSGWESGRASLVRQRLAIEFHGWDQNHARCEEQINKVILALRADEHAREKPPISRL
jgi:uncharacterized protein YjbI with pentapeptide repeats